ncbi:MAG: hypothetical protein LBI38_02225 [Oscillospiraceae bacterium]|jgi:hypothetical protein|nr:hypothetical protein [Oscillospiraceae bacterium]
MKKKLLSAVVAVIIAVTAIPGITAGAEAATKSAAQIEKELNAAVKEIIKTIPKGASDYEKIRILYKWMTENVKYDYNASNKVKGYKNPYGDGSPAGALVGKLAVCSGYARGYELLLRKVGIESVVLSSTEMDHGWNLVKMNGKWYHCDATWDNKADNLDSPYYSYFLLSDRAINRPVDGVEDYWKGRNTPPKSATTSFGIPAAVERKSLETGNGFAVTHYKNLIVYFTFGSRTIGSRSSDVVKQVGRYDVKTGKTTVINKNLDITPLQLIHSNEKVVIYFDGQYRDDESYGFDKPPESRNLKKIDVKTGKTTTIGKIGSYLDITATKDRVVWSERGTVTTAATGANRVTTGVKMYRADTNKVTTVWKPGSAKDYKLSDFDEQSWGGNHKNPVLKNVLFYHRADIRGEYLVCEFWGSGVVECDTVWGRDEVIWDGLHQTAVYRLSDGKEIAKRDDLTGGFVGIDGDLAFFYIHFIGNYGSPEAYVNIGMEILNIKTGKVTKAKTTFTANPEGSETIKLVGSHNGKVYFVSNNNGGLDYNCDLNKNLYCYDIKKNAFTKLSQPADVKKGYGFYEVKIVESKGKTYLQFSLAKDLLATSEIVKKREIK